MMSKLNPDSALVVCKNKKMRAAAGNRGNYMEKSERVPFFIVGRE